MNWVAMRGGVFDTRAPHHPLSLSLLPPAQSRNRNQLLPTGGHTFTRAASEASGGTRASYTTIVHSRATHLSNSGGENIFTHMLEIHGSVFISLRLQLWGASL